MKNIKYCVLVICLIALSCSYKYNYNAVYDLWGRSYVLLDSNSKFQYIVMDSTDLYWFGASEGQWKEKWRPGRIEITPGYTHRNFPISVDEKRWKDDDSVRFVLGAGWSYADSIYLDTGGELYRIRLYEPLTLHRNKFHESGQFRVLAHKEELLIPFVEIRHNEIVSEAYAVKVRDNNLFTITPATGEWMDGITGIFYLDHIIYTIDLRQKKIVYYDLWTEDWDKYMIENDSVYHAWGYYYDYGFNGYIHKETGRRFKRLTMSI